MTLQVTNEDLIVLNGGGKTTDTGHRSHYPIWLSDMGVEFISLDGQSFTPLSSIKNLNVVQRETVERK